MRMTNRANRRIYRLWAPVYDGVFDRWFAAPGRRRALEVLAAQPGERLLLIGIGTGADLPLLPAGVQAVGVDLSPEMLARARSRLPLPGRAVALIQGDALALPLRAGLFDAVVLNLILSVVPDGGACLRQALQMLKPAGRVVIFDKFVRDGARLSLGRRLVNRVTTLIGTDVTRRLGDILGGCACTIVHDEPSLLGGAYRIVALRPEPGRGTARAAG